MTFAPQKTVKANVGLVVQKSTGGRWRFNLKLEATQPEMDGSIIIEAAPGQAATAPVWLFSPVDWPLPFTCHFTHDSSIQFDMWPTEVGCSCIIQLDSICTSSASGTAGKQAASAQLADCMTVAFSSGCETQRMVPTHICTSLQFIVEWL